MTVLVRQSFFLSLLCSRLLTLSKFKITCFNREATKRLTLRANGVSEESRKIILCTISEQDEKIIKIYMMNWK